MLPFTFPYVSQLLRNLEAECDITVICKTDGCNHSPSWNKWIFAMNFLHVKKDIIRVVLLKKINTVHMTYSHSFSNDSKLWQHWVKGPLKCPHSQTIKIWVLGNFSSQLMIATASIPPTCLFPLTPSILFWLLALKVEAPNSPWKSYLWPHPISALLMATH